MCLLKVFRHLQEIHLSATVRGELDHDAVCVCAAHRNGGEDMGLLLSGRQENTLQSLIGR